MKAHLRRNLPAIICALLLLRGSPPPAAGQSQQPEQSQQPAEQSVKIPPDQLDSLVAPIALYPDPLLSQTLVASTYPLEIVQLQQWLEKNKGLKDKALADAVEKQPWDPSIKAMAGLPDVVKLLADDVQWTTDLGNAFLAEQGDVMDAIQRMRAKAKANGALESNDKQKVETQQEADKTVIVVEQADPQVVYVPSYNPVVVYGPAVYPYPPIYYPPSTGAVVAASAISFGAGVAMGAFWSGGWGWNAGWGHNDIDINRNNTFNRNTNISGSRGNAWQHNPQHRGGAPYPDRTTANRFGSNARGDSLAGRQKGAQQQIARQKGNLPSAGAGARAGAGGPDRIGNRNVGSAPARGGRDAFNPGSGGFSGSSARASSSRGSASLGGASRGGRAGGGGFGGRGGGRR